GYGAQEDKIASGCVKGPSPAPRWAQRQNPPPSPCRRRSAWRRRREIHSRTPYPSANPTVRAIVRSSIRVGTTTALEIIIESYLPLVNGKMYRAVPIAWAAQIPATSSTPALVAPLTRWNQNSRWPFRCGCQALRQRARHRGRHPHLNDRAHGAVPVVQEMQGDFYAFVYDSGRRQFRCSEVMRCGPSEFSNHGGPSRLRGPPMPRHVQLT